MDIATATNMAYAKMLLKGLWKSHALAQIQAAMVTGGDDPALAALYSQILGALGDNSNPDLSRVETPLAIVREKSILSTLQLKTLTDPWLKKISFKQGVYYIDIETSSQCNRRCSYCTNSINDRFTSNHFIEEETFELFINQLSEIEYDQEIHFVGYNEPLMHREHIVKSIRHAREKLPEANLMVFTNGDFLEPGYINELHHAGLNSINISIHTAPGQIYSDGEMISRIYQMGKKLGIDPVLKGFEKGCFIEASFPYKSLHISMYQKDYSHLGHNRGGLLHDVGEEHHRVAACFAPLLQFVVGHTGNVMPCCAMVSDDDHHEPYIVGKITKSQTIFDIYAGRPFVTWRRRMLSLGPKSGPCQSCNGEAHFPDHNNEATFALVAKHLCDGTV